MRDGNKFGTDISDSFVSDVMTVYIRNTVVVFGFFWGDELIEKWRL